MSLDYSDPNPAAGPAPEGAAPLLSLPVNVDDYSGRKRQGRAVLLPSWPASGGASDRPTEGEDFRIVILLEPPESPISPAEGVVVSVPARRLAAAAAALREPAATYGAPKQSGLALSSKDLELLRQGSLVAAIPLPITAEDVYSEGAARLTLLARELLAGKACQEYLNPIAIALSAPAPAKPASQERLEELKDLLAAVSGIASGDRAEEAEAALARVSELAFAASGDEFLTCAERIYPNRQALMEDIYLLRALRQDREQANELLSMRRFLEGATVPPEEADLALDRSLVTEQLTFVVLAAEPQRLPLARAALERFRQRYISRYREHHTSYWSEMARLHARLLSEQPRLEALRRLNTLSELGPPVGAGALAALEELLEDTAGCPLIAGVEEMAETDGLCPHCRITLERHPPAERIEEIIKRINLASDRQLARLSSSAIHQVLRRSNDARVNEFLKVVQASQLTQMSDIIDDELVGYLRRFLVESRIQEALQPILSRLQEGAPPKVDEARTAMREVSQVLQRAFQATQRALPPGEVVSNGGAPPGRKRKR